MAIDDIVETLTYTSSEDELIRARDIIVTRLRELELNDKETEEKEVLEEMEEEYEEEEEE